MANDHTQAQIGRTTTFAKEIDAVDDDYVYRQEDFVFSDIARKGGGVEGKIDTVFHYHQTIKRLPTFGIHKTSKLRFHKH
jgi:hypothetical protein